MNERFDDLLRDTLSDDRWDLTARPELIDEVRRARSRRSRRRAASTAALAALVASGLVLGLHALPESDDQLATYAAGGVPAGSPAPGISPAWAPQRGRDWLLSTSEADAFWATHTRPSPRPGQSVVESPAPLGPQSESLLQDVQAADLPTGAALRREDAMGGQPDAPGVHITLLDGTPVEVYRLWADGPMTFGAAESGLRRQDLVVEDVPGTLSAVVAFPDLAYGFGPAARGDRSIGVTTLSRGGEWTTWAAPSRVGLARLKAWAVAAAQHAGD